LKQGAIASGILVSSGAGIAGAQPGEGNGKAAKCDIVVPNDYGTIQEAVNNASAGDTICIRQGTYEERISIDKEVTLRGQNAPNSSNPATVDGRISVNSGGANTTVRRLKITSSETFEGGTFPDPFGVRVKASGVTVENNVIEDFTADLSNGGGSFTLHGVQIFGETAISDITVRDNEIRGFESDGVPGEWPKYGGIAGVKAQADVENVTVENNDVADHHSAGWVWGVVLTTSDSASGVPESVTVEKNDLSGLNDGSVYDVFAEANERRGPAPYPDSAFENDGAADAREATVKQNNLLAPNGAESKDGDHTLVAECNWWGDRSGPTDDDNPDGTGTWALERGAATIDYTPWLTAPAPSNACNGGTKGNAGSGQ
jgi:hypothetical protein